VPARPDSGRLLGMRRRSVTPPQRSGGHPWRLVESAIGFFALCALVTFGVAWPLLDSIGLHPPAMAVPAAVEYAAVLLTPGAWLALFVRLGLSAWGRAYLQSTADEDLAQQNVESQPNNLTIAGLVLATLAVTSGKVLAGASGQMLVASLAGFLLAWAIGAGPYRKSGMIASDAMHWTGLSMLLAAVADLSAADGIPTGQVVAALVTGLVAVYSFTLARGYWLSAAPGPAGVDRSRPGPRTG